MFVAQWERTARACRAAAALIYLHSRLLRAAAAANSSFSRHCRQAATSFKRYDRSGDNIGQMRAYSSVCASESLAVGGVKRGWRCGWVSLLGEGHWLCAVMRSLSYCVYVCVSSEHAQPRSTDERLFLCVFSHASSHSSFCSSVTSLLLKPEPSHIIHWLVLSRVKHSCRRCTRNGFKCDRRCAVCM